jgi:hypothetical protein
MNDNRNLVIVAVLGVALLAMQSSESPERPRPAPNDVPDMVEVFAEGRSPEEAKQHAQELGELCASLARKIEYDGTVREPRLKTAAHVQEFRTYGRDNKAEGGSYAAAYPKLSKKLTKFFDDRVGSKDEPLSDGKRRDWITAFRDLSAACHYAAQEL